MSDLPEEAIEAVQDGFYPKPVQVLKGTPCEHCGNGYVWTAE